MEGRREKQKSPSQSVEQETDGQDKKPNAFVDVDGNKVMATEETENNGVRVQDQVTVPSGSIFENMESA